MLADGLSTEGRGEMNVELKRGDALKLMAKMENGAVDMVIGSPPYEDARIGGGTLRGEDWVRWMKQVVLESLRVCSGLVAFVVEGRTRKFRWSATPVLLMADLHRAGVKLRKPPIFARHGIPGSGGPDWWRNDYEFVICASHGRLAWSDPTAVGWACKYPRGGATSHRTRGGDRVRGTANDARPAVTNPGNIVKGLVGKGHMGDDLAHEHDAPYPEWLVEKFVKCFCEPGGVVLDPFIGSGTTAAVALKLGRGCIGFDVDRKSIALSKRRVKKVLEGS